MAGVDFCKSRQFFNFPMNVAVYSSVFEFKNKVKKSALGNSSREEIFRTQLL